MKHTVYTVVPASGMNVDSEYQVYEDLMKERGLSHAPLIPVKQEDGSCKLTKVAMCLWDTEADAQSFADEFHKRLRISKWVVKPIEVE